MSEIRDEVKAAVGRMLDAIDGDRAEVTADDIHMVAYWTYVTADEDHSEAARILAARGGRKGGKARAEKLSPERRSEIARKAANARWGRG